MTENNINNKSQCHLSILMIEIRLKQGKMSGQEIDRIHPHLYLQKYVLEIVTVTGIISVKNSKPVLGE